MNIKLNKIIKKNISGERSSHTQLSVFFPTAIDCAPAWHAPRSVSVPMISLSGPATAEALRHLKSRGSHMDLADGMETGSPYLHLHSPDLALSRGRSLCCSSSPLSENAIICSRVFLSREINIVLYPSGSRVAEATRALWSFLVHYMKFSHQTVFTCLGV